MSLKEFFKPDGRKIIVYTIIFACIFILPLITFFAPTCAADVKCMEAFMFYFRVALTAIIPVYFLSCVYVWIYDVLKKVPKRIKKRK